MPALKTSSSVVGAVLVASEIEAVVDRALAEDLAGGDPTTASIIAPDVQDRGVIVARSEGVLAGVDVARLVFQRVDSGLEFKSLMADGSKLEPESFVAEVEGPVSSTLRAERTALNFLQHLSGVATETARYVKAVESSRARILDTRKTLPGLRVLEKYAVRIGGGRNHRMNLGDGILVKDNHIVAARRSGLDLGDVVRKARNSGPHTLRIEVEVEDLDEARQALDAGADILLLDNMGLEQMAEAVRLAQGRALTEASGGIKLENVADVAATGVDLISVGSLTHSAKALDLSLDLV